VGDLVNLREARKRKDRERKAATAAENRTAFGLSKIERRKREAERVKADRDLDAHRREPPDGA
jgi:hypothetical protein